MSVRKFILFLWVLLTPLFAFALNKAGVSGTIIDSVTLRPLAYVNVYLPDSPIGCVSDSAGHFELVNLPGGEHRLIFQRVGYQHVEKVITINQARILRLKVKMTTRISNADDILVEGARWHSPFYDFFQGGHHLSRQQITDQPGAFNDPLRALQIITGVVNQSDFTSNMFIRGSSPNDQAIILDGVLLQNPYRLRMAGYGGISIINPDIIDLLRISLGGFPANYGLRNGGMVEINTLDGSSHWINRLSLNMVSTRYLLSGPLHNNIKFIFSARKTYYDIVLKKITASRTNYPFFTDTFAKLVWQASPKFTLKIATLFGHEGSDILNNRLFNGRIFSRSKNMIVYGTIRGFLTKQLDYEVTFSRQTNFDSLSASSSMVDYYRSYRVRANRSALHSQVEWEANNRFSVALGADFFRVRQKWFHSQENPLFAYHGYAFYLNEHYRIQKNLRLKLGLRCDYSDINRQTTYDPRLSLFWKINSVSNLGLAYGIYHQLPRKFDFGNRDLSAVPDSLLSKFRTPYLNYLGLKFTYSPLQNWSMRIETYLKQGFHLLSWQRTVSGTRAIGDRGRDLAKGIEVNINYKNPKWKMHLGYDYSVALIKGAGNPFWQYKDFDVRHVFNWFLSYRLKTHFRIRSLIRASSGPPVNEPIGWYKSGDQSWDLIPITVINRYPYFRWDLRFSYHRKHWLAYFEIINLSDHKNFYQELFSAYFRSKQAILRNYVTYMLPRLPILGASFEF